MSMRKIRDATEIIARLEGGDLAADLSKEIETAIVALTEHAGDRNVARGSLTLTLSFEIAHGKAEITADIKSKLPKRLRRTSFFFATDDGALSLEHPSQHDMFPREIAGARQSRGGQD